MADVLSRFICAKKKFYRSKATAKKDAKRIKKALGKRLFAYDCPHCDFWHLTKAKQNQNENDFENA